MDQDTNGLTPERTTNQPACMSSPALGIAALAEYRAYLLNAVSDKDRDADEVCAVETMILCGKLASRDDVLSLAYVLAIELQLLAENVDDDDEDAPRLRRLHKAAEAVWRGLMQHCGATSPMIAEWLR